MSEAVDRLAAALTDCVGVGNPTSLAGWLTMKDPALAEALELGLAFEEAAAALPEGAVVEGLSWERGKEGPPDARYPDRWHARAYRWDKDRPWHRLYGEPAATPAEALRNLAAKLKP